MTELIHATVSSRAPQRLDTYLTSVLDLSRTKIKAWCSAGKVEVDGVARKGSFMVMEGHQITYPLPEPDQIVEIVPQDIPIDVVFEDDQIAIVNKAAGMVVHPGSGVKDHTLVNALVHHFGSLPKTGGSVRPGIVHRLDRGTTGLMVIAKTDRAHAALTSAWQSGSVTKVYQALVWGIPDPEQGEIESHIGRHPVDRKRMAAEVEHGKYAHSRYKIIDRFKEAARINVHILTGRTHQIRVHLAHIDHPVVGDAMYGRRRHQNLAKQFLEMPQFPMLHAGLLRFPHPESGEVLTFKLAPNGTFEETAAALARWPY